MKKTTMGISSNDNGKKVSNSKDVITALKEVLNGRELKLITEVLKNIKAGLDMTKSLQ